MSKLMALLRRWRLIWCAREELDEGPLALYRAIYRGPAQPDVIGRAVSDHSLGLCDACNVAWGVEIWLHPDQLLVTVLCHQHSTDQAIALQERRWSRLVRPSTQVRVPTA